jgi:hypothetical protein
MLRKFVFVIACLFIAQPVSAQECLLLSTVAGKPDYEISFSTVTSSGYIVYEVVSRISSGRMFYSVPVNGRGSAVKLYDEQEKGNLADSGYGGISPDGMSILFRTQSGQVFITKVASGETLEISTLPTDDTVLEHFYADDGNIFTLLDTGTEASLYLTNIETGEVKLITDQIARDERYGLRYFWVRNQLLFIGTGQDNKQNLYVQSKDGVLINLSGDLPVLGLYLSPLLVTEQHVVFRVRGENSHTSLFSASLIDGQTTQLADVPNLSTAYDAVRISPDGQWVVYLDAGNRTLNSVPIDGSEPPIELAQLVDYLVPPGAYPVTFEIDPNSEHVVFVNDRDVYRVLISGGGSELLASDMDLYMTAYPYFIGNNLIVSTLSANEMITEYLVSTDSDGMVRILRQYNYYRGRRPLDYADSILFSIAETDQTYRIYRAPLDDLSFRVPIGCSIEGEAELIWIYNDYVAYIVRTQEADLIYALWLPETHFASPHAVAMGELVPQTTTPADLIPKH